MEADSRGGSLQAAATAIGVGTALDITGFNTVVFTISGTFVGTVTIEGSTDGSTYSPIIATPMATGAPATTATGTGLYRANVVGLTKVRAEVTAYTSGNITVDARAVLEDSEDEALVVGMQGITGGVPVPTTPGAATVTGPTTLQNAATVTGNGTNLNVAGMATAVLLPTFTAGTGAIVVEGSPDDTNWVTLFLYKNDGTVVTSIVQTATLVPHRVNVTGLKSIRARISAVVTGPITVVGWTQATAGPLPMQQVAMTGKNVAAGDTALLASPAGRSQAAIITSSGGVAQDALTNNSANFFVTTADGLGIGQVAPSNYNGATWDRVRNNTDLTLLASAARTATNQSANQTNYNGRGVVIFLNVAIASGTGGLQLQIIGIDPASGVAFALNATPTAVITATRQAFVLYPGASGAAAGHIAQQAAGLLPRIWYVNVVHGDASSYTYSVGASVIL